MVKLFIIPLITGHSFIQKPYIEHLRCARFCTDQGTSHSPGLDLKERNEQIKKTEKFLMYCLYQGQAHELQEYRGGATNSSQKYGVGWAGHRILPRKVELILKGAVRIPPGDEDGGKGPSRAEELAQAKVHQYQRGRTFGELSEAWHIEYRVHEISGQP